MEWNVEALRETLWIGERLVWGAQIETNEPADAVWVSRHIYFTNRRVLWFNWHGVVTTTRSTGEVRYDEVSKVGNAGPSSGGLKGVRALHAGGGCILLRSPRASMDLQFQDGQSLQYAKWLINEATQGKDLHPVEGVPSVEGVRDPNASPSPPTPTTTSGCFIATAAYGADHANLDMLRAYRDAVLQRSIGGRVFVRLYYLSSPPLARFIGRSEVRRSLARTVLEPIVRMAGRRVVRREDAADPTGRHTPPQ